MNKRSLRKEMHKLLYLTVRGTDKYPIYVQYIQNMCIYLYTYSNIYVLILRVCLKIISPPPTFKNIKKLSNMGCLPTINHIQTEISLKVSPTFSPPDVPPRSHLTAVDGINEIWVVHRIGGLIRGSSLWGLWGGLLPRNQPLRSAISTTGGYSRWTSH